MINTQKCFPMIYDMSILKKCQFRAKICLIMNELFTNYGNKSLDVYLKWAIPVPCITKDSKNPLQQFITCLCWQNVNFMYICLNYGTIMHKFGQ